MRSERAFRMHLWRVASLWLFVAATASGTTPFGNTFIVKTNGVWHCPRFYTCNLIIADEDNGLRTEVPLKGLFPGAEYDAHVHDTTAGPRWGIASLPFITRQGERDYFYMHCWTGKQLLLALDTAKLARPATLAAQLAEEERKHVLVTLTNAVACLQAGEGVRDEELDGAILIAAARGEKSVKPLLEAIEALGGRFGPLGFIPNYSYGASWSGRFPEQTYRIAQHRRFAQIALRRLGLAPKGYPAVVFDEAKENVVFSPEERAASIPRLRVGQSSREVLKLLGPPDYLETAVENRADKPPVAWHRRWVDAWRYDLASPNDFSVLIIWSDQGRAERIERVTPGLWYGDALFTARMPRPVFGPDGSINGIHLYSREFTGTIGVLTPSRPKDLPQAASPNAGPPPR